MMTAVRKIKRIPKMIAFCCKFRLILIEGRLLLEDRLVLEERLVVFLRDVFALLALLLRVIGQMFLVRRL